MEEAIDKVINIFFSNKGKIENLESSDFTIGMFGVCSLKKLDSNEEKLALNEEKWKTARAMLRDEIIILLNNKKEVKLTSTYQAEGLLAKCLEGAGLKTAMTVPCQTYASIVPITFEVYIYSPESQ
jgi:hypothetical protein